MCQIPIIVEPFYGSRGIIAINDKVDDKKYN